MSFIQRLDNDKSKNWYKISISLGIVASAIRNFTQTTITDLHDKLKKDVGLGPNVNCTTCKGKDVKYGWHDKSWSITCGNQVCDKWLVKIKGQHINQSNRTLELLIGNCNIQLWPSHAWEVGKAYMPKGQKSKKIAEDFDVAALLSVLNDCKYARLQLADKPGLPNKVKEIRNHIMHCATMEAEQDEVEKDLATMVQLLELPRISQYKEAKSAVEEIGKIHKVDLVITSEAEVQADKERIRALEEQLAAALAQPLMVAQAATADDEKEERVSPAEVVNTAMKTLEFIEQTGTLAESLVEEVSSLRALVKNNVQKMDEHYKDWMWDDCVEWPETTAYIFVEGHFLPVYGPQPDRRTNKLKLQCYTETHDLSPPTYINQQDRHTDAWKSEVAIGGKTFKSDHFYCHVLEAEQGAAGVALKCLEE